MVLDRRLYCVPMRALFRIAHARIAIARIAHARIAIARIAIARIAIARIAIAAIAFVGMMTLLSSINAAHAIGPHDRHLTSAHHGISIEAPAGWTLSQHTGYGDTVVVLLHPDGSRISVTAAPTHAADARALFEQNRKGLLAQHLVPSDLQPGPRGFIAVDLTSPSSPNRLRQLYLVRATASGNQAIVLTLMGKGNAFAEQRTALDFVVTRLELDDPERPTMAKDAGVAGARQDAGTSAPSPNAGGSGGQVAPRERQRSSAPQHL